MQVSPVHSGRDPGKTPVQGHPRETRVAGCLLEHPNLESWSAHLVQMPESLNQTHGFFPRLLRFPWPGTSDSFLPLPFSGTVTRPSSLSLGHPSHASSPFHCLCHQPAGPSLLNFTLDLFATASCLGSLTRGFCLPGPLWSQDALGKSLSSHPSPPTAHGLHPRLLVGV